MIDEIQALSKMMLNPETPATVLKEQAHRVYVLLDTYIKQEAVAAETLDDLQALDDCRIVRTQLKKKFGLKIQ